VLIIKKIENYRTMMVKDSMRMEELEREVANKSHSNQGPPLLTSSSSPVNMARQPNTNGPEFLWQNQALLAFADDEINMGGQAPEDEEVNMGGHAMDTGRPKERGRSLDEDEEEDLGVDIFKPLDEDKEDSGGGDIHMGEQLMDNNQPRQAQAPERKEINKDAHAMDTGRPKRRKHAKRRLDEDEEDFGLDEIDDFDDSSSTEGTEGVSIVLARKSGYMTDCPIGIE
jgi:hypothetical protein